MMEDDPLINKTNSTESVLNENPGARRSPDYFGRSDETGQVDVIGKHDKKQVNFPWI